MRTYDEIAKDLRQAADIHDAQALRTLATEMQALGTLKSQASSWRALGMAAKFTSEHALALENFRHALSAFEELNDRPRVAIIFGEIGVVYTNMGDFSSALEYLQRSLAMHEESGNREGMASDNHNIGLVHNDTGNYASALMHFHRAVALYEELGDRAGVAIATGNVGRVHRSTGDYPSALAHAQRALTLLEELGNRTAIANIIGDIGTVYIDIGDYPSALEHFHRALALHEELGNRSGVASYTGNIGIPHVNTGDYLSALKCFQDALVLHEELGNRASMALVTGNMIEVLVKLDRLDEADTMLERQASMSMDNPVIRAQHLSLGAALAERRDDLEAAHDHLLNALEICTENGLRAQSAETHGRLRDLAQKRNDFAGYIEHNSEYQRITEELRGKEATQRLTMMEAERKMEGERRERDKERALLYGALPKTVADRMIRGEKITGDHFDHAAVLFIDVAAFTTHTASMHPGDVVLLLEDLFSRMDRICDQHGVVKVKTIGDSYMCFAYEGNGELGMGNGELGMGNSVEQRVAAVALAVQQAVFYWPREASPEGLPVGLLDRLLFRIGIHSGPVTAGVIGTQRLQYDVWGDTVNVASRMESTGEPGRIHVSEAFASFLGLRPRNDSPSAGEREGRYVIPSEARNEELGTWHLALRGATELKGKGTMTTYWLSHT